MFREHVSQALFHLISPILMKTHNANACSLLLYRFNNTSLYYSIISIGISNASLGLRGGSHANAKRMAPAGRAESRPDSRLRPGVSDNSDRKPGARGTWVTCDRA